MLSGGFGPAPVARRRIPVAAIVLLVAVVVAPFVIYPFFLMKVMCFGILAASFGFLLGNAGMLSFGHAAFFGFGSYTTAYLARQYGVPTELSLIAGMLGAFLLSTLFGLVAIRRQGIYFAMTTLALAQIVFFLSVQLPGITGGENGIIGVPRGTLLGLVDLRTEWVMYCFVSVVFFAALAILYRARYSPFGHALRAARSNEPRAMSMGFESVRHKFIAFVISGTLSGLAGGLKALVTQTATLTDVHWAVSGEVVLMSLIGGVGTILGPVIGAGIISALNTYLAPLGDFIPAIQGVLFIFCVLVFREGIAGLVMNLFKRMRRGPAG